MKWPLRFRGAVAPTVPATSRAERPLQALLAASIILPILIFTGVSSIACYRHFEDARSDLGRALDQIYEHASKVFETFELTARCAPPGKPGAP